MLEQDEEVSSIPNQTRIIQESVGHSKQMQVFSEQRDVTVSCVDTGSNHAERCTHEKEHDENSPKLGAEYTKIECYRNGVHRKSRGCDDLA